METVVRRSPVRVFLSVALMVVALASLVRAADDFGSASTVEGINPRALAYRLQEESASELNRKLTNPVSTLWSLSNQFNNFKLENSHWNNNWNFQPVLPISLTKDWNLITRPVMPFYNIVQHETASGQFERTAGLGDMILLELLSPAHSGHWVLGAGPTFIFPTATSKFTGQGKWQAGPSVVAGYLTKEFFLGVFPQQWFSIGGDPNRPDTSQLNLQPIATVFFGDGWNIGYSGNILANWKASSGDVWTVPVGVGVGKVVKFGRLPVKIELSLQRSRLAHAPRRTGIVNVNVEPSPTWLLSQIRPPWSSMNFRDSASPSPVPSTFLSAVPTCRNSLNTAS